MKKGELVESLKLKHHRMNSSKSFIMLQKLEIRAQTLWIMSIILFELFDEDQFILFSIQHILDISIWILYSDIYSNSDSNIHFKITIIYSFWMPFLVLFFKPSSPRTCWCLTLDLLDPVTFAVYFLAANNPLYKESYPSIQSKSLTHSSSCFNDHIPYKSKHYHRLGLIGHHVFH